jgi:hypothetical protein
LYNADGTMEKNNVWDNIPFRFPSKPGPTQLVSRDGSIVNGYQHSIIRPFDNVSVPRDITRGPFEGRECNWPCYAGSNFQEWCSEDNAINYFAMRPLVSPDTYNEWLVILFKTVTEPFRKTNLK